MSNRSRSKPGRPAPLPVPAGAVMLGGSNGVPPEMAAQQRRVADGIKAIQNYEDDPCAPGESGIEMVGDRVLVRRHQVTETVGKLMLAGSAADSLRTPTGTVVGVGPDCKQVKNGDNVLVDPSAPAFPVMRPSGKLYVMKEGQLIGIDRSPQMQPPPAGGAGDAPPEAVPGTLITE